MQKCSFDGEEKKSYYDAKSNNGDRSKTSKKASVEIPGMELCIRGTNGFKQKILKFKI